MAGTRASVQVPVDGAGKKLDSFSYDLSDGRGTNYANTQVIVDQDGNTVDVIADGNGGNAVEVAQAATNFIHSTNNSSIAQLAASATFTGVVETIFNQQTVSLLITSDQPGTLHIMQYIDSGATRKISDWTYTIAASVPFSRSITANGNYFNLSYQNTGGSTTTTLNIDCAYGTLPAATNLGNQPVAINEMNAAPTFIDGLGGSAGLQFAYFNVSTAQTGVSLVSTPGAGKSIRVISYAVVVGTAMNVSLIGASTTLLFALAANAGVSFAGSVLGPAFQVAANTALTYTTSGAGQATGHISYVIV